MQISIIIPTYNRSLTLKKTIISIYKQADLKDVEVIIVDNGSTDDTAQICHLYENEKPLLRYYYDAEPGLLTGRHLGASIAEGKILCFLDDDVELSPNWVNGVKDAFSNPAIQLATGPCLPTYEIAPPLWVNFFRMNLKEGGSVCSWLSLIDLGKEQKLISPNYVWGLNFCIRKSALIALGGFHPDNIPTRLQHFQGDGESGLTIKAESENYSSLYHPKIMLHHYISAERLTPEYFKKRAFYQGVCNSFTILKYTHEEQVALNEHPSISHKIKDIIKKGVHYLKLYKIKLHNLLFIPAKIRAMKKLLVIEERKGYEFHQKAFEANKKVKDWVSKKDYWDYKLPA